jgi:molybdopterin-guanine dinucleotide biosynthesis protein A
MEHRKHAKLAPPAFGRWARREWAIHGTGCGNIQWLARELSLRLSARWKTGFLDAEHNAAGEPGVGMPYALQWTDRIGSPRLDLAQTPGPWEQRAWLNELDLALVNGNHFEATRQIVALDRRKFDSLSRKAERLTQVDLFLTRAGDPDFATPDELPVAVKDRLPGWRHVPVLDWTATDAIAGFLEKNLPPAPVKALVLAGGKSIRMGQDKAEIRYHDKPQWQFLWDMLQENGLEAFVSCREEQAGAFGDTTVIADSFTGLGPMGAILSAFRHDPAAAWLVLACDLPRFDRPALDFLRRNRNPSALATAFRQPGNEGFPEPLVAIWEPKAYLRLLTFLAQGVSCPRKVLINSDTMLLDAPDPEALVNVNTPEERAALERSGRLGTP